MKKISYSQVIILLFIIRILKTMTFNPFINTSSVILMLAVLASTLFQGLLFVPVAYIYKCCPGKDVNELAYGVSKAFGICVSLIYKLYFLLAILRAVKHFTYFMVQMFPGVGGRIVISVALLAVAGYGAYLGLESIARTSVFVGGILFVMFALIITTTKGELDFLNVNMISESPFKSFLSCFIQEIGMNSEIIAFAVLLPYIKSGIKKAFAGLLVLKLVVIELIIFLYTALFGDYMKEIILPFFSAGAFSKTQFVERFDPVYMVVWTLCAVVGVSLSIFFAVRCGKNVFIKIKEKYLYFIITVLCMAVFVIFRVEISTIDRAFDRWINSLLTVVLTGILPLVTFLIYRKKACRTGDKV